MEKPEITTVSGKGQVVIPQSLRKNLGLTPKTKLMVFGYDDTLILKKLYLPDLKKEWGKIRKVIDKRIEKFGELTEKEIADEMHAYRKEKGLLK